MAMDIQTEKIRLIEWLAGLNNAQTISEFISLKKSKEQDWWDEISTDEQLAIKEGLAELNNGEGIPHEQGASEVQCMSKSISMVTSFDPRLPEHT